ncbi:transcription factor mef2A isoform X2 [Sitodiplosis mosellana]|uniref:transcription factor mef2A isoform X2 n=1 Tax=Sitodiplosis mosellana TaxID=263140 RepID=UPI002443F1E4|nr:transcription factor mef2A isoform X2 [Sitodiplosis mosellana]XP_055324251.1 transcription factor mef2A isoform X2 [Sitodiplosis mosellana]XP_055324252.1 transcription factor mef2A isoform X2 [Sitodiplosis mosellana]XP_055324253.1 transcription factor mef2A isoform X2 [Sitodiplosis mosellana]XP_055324254.1 transcription factor mef2A isoform X2 [Sitodiplosis mosellana]XP_055324256.1 transcription factor mef2A isoform X2 [Sitodiplosis mosellana]
MAVFLINICKFNGCGIKFDSLGELITHIENIHIDYDPHVVEQKEQSQPACLPLSYVLRFITDAARKEGPFINSSSGATDLKRKLAIKHHSYSMSSSNRSTTPTGSEIDDEEMIVSESENSNDSWTTEEFSSEFIMRYGSRHSGTAGNSASNEKPFACPVPGCKKRYKNVNGIKYHSKNGHKKEGKVRKGFKCYCGKSYKTSQGLKNHSMVVHNTTSTEALNNSVTRPHSPASNGGNNFSSQSQLSPNGSTNGSTPVNTTTLSASSSPTFTQSVPQTNQITLKTAPPTTNLIAVNSLAVSSPPNNNNNNNNTSNNNNNNNNNKNSHALLSTHNPNKLVKLNTECFDGVLVGTKASGKNLIITSTANGTSSGNIIVSTATAIPPNVNADETNGNGAKINLPSLVNLGILTPATSPKQHTQLTPQISPNHTPASNTNNATNNNSSNNNNNNNNESTLPLTPISPLNKTFNGAASVSIGNTTSNNNNTTSPNLNNGHLASSITADGSLTEDT